MNHAAICARLPHAGSMCLLDRLARWDEDSITCIATSHRDPDNPLRAHGRLHAVCGVEYAAQAMALHGSLLNDPDGPTARDGGSAGNAGAVFRPPAMGYLASVRDLKLDIEDLGAVSGDLQVAARRLSGDAGGFIYEFQIDADGRRLLSGRVAAKLLAAGT
jgi:predicted hotdog family 3-hydroxylacyl-ACP dehydratase